MFLNILDYKETVVDATDQNNIEIKSEDKTADMVRLINELHNTPVDTVPLINHCFAQYIAKVLIRKRELQDVILSALSFISNNGTNSFILDIPYIMKLSEDYEDFYTKLLDPSYVVVKADDMCYGYGNFGLHRVMNKDIYAKFTAKSRSIPLIQQAIARGMNSYIGA